MATTPYTLNVVNGTELQLSLSTAGPAGPAGDPSVLLTSANTWTDTQSFLGFTVNGLSFYGPFATFTYTGSTAETHRTALGAAEAVHTHVSDDITDATDSADGGKIAKYTSTSGLFSLGLELYNGTSTTDLAPESGSANHTITVPAADGTMALTSDIPARYSDVAEALVDASSTTPVKVVSVVLPIGTYQLDACVSTICSAVSGSVITLNSSNNIRLALTDYFGRNDVAPTGSSVISDAATSLARVQTGFTSFRRHLTGVITIITNNTEVYLDIAQEVAGATPTTSRKMSYIIAQKLS